LMRATPCVLHSRGARSFTLRMGECAHSVIRHIGNVLHRALLQHTRTSLSDVALLRSVTSRSHTAHCTSRTPFFETQSKKLHSTRWHGQTGCSVSAHPPCTDPCTAGDCGNWDMYTCPATSGGAAACSDPPEPPAPPPPSPPAPPGGKFGFDRALSDHMVLQRLVPARVWGADATPKGAVVVKLSNAAGTTHHEVNTIADGVLATHIYVMSTLSLHPPRTARSVFNRHHQFAILSGHALLHLHRGGSVVCRPASAERKHLSVDRHNTRHGLEQVGGSVGRVVW